MQFLAAKSLCRTCLEERYFIPLATSRQKFISKLWVRSYVCKCLHISIHTCTQISICIYIHMQCHVNIPYGYYYFVTILLTTRLLQIQLMQFYRDYLTQKYLWCKKVWIISVVPNKVELYLEVKALTDWWQQDLISVCGQGLAYWTHNYIGHIIASYCFQSLFELANLLSAISCYKFCTAPWLTREHKFTLICHLTTFCQWLHRNKKIAKW